MNDERKVVLCREFLELTSKQKGTRYFSGFAGPVQYLMFDTGKTKELKSRPGEAVPIWRLMIQEADPDRRPGARQDERPRHDGQSVGHSEAPRLVPGRTPGGAILDAVPRDRERGAWSTDPGQRDGPGGPDDEIPF